MKIDTEIEKALLYIIYEFKLPSTLYTTHLLLALPLSALALIKLFVLLFERFIIGWLNLIDSETRWSGTTVSGALIAVPQLPTASCGRL